MLGVDQVTLTGMEIRTNIYLQGKIWSNYLIFRIKIAGIYTLIFNTHNSNIFFFMTFKKYYIM